MEIKNNPSFIKQDGVWYSLLKKTGPSTYEIPTENCRNQTCTDFFTDSLMCKDNNYFKYDIDTKTDNQIVVSSTITTIKRLLDRLPHLHALEKVNNFSKTKVTVLSKTAVALTFSRKWYQSTFALSCYLKVLRSMARGDWEYDFNVPLLQKIMWSGKISKVNKGLKHKHGWSGKNMGTHSNNGIQATMWNFRVATATGDPYWEVAARNKAKKDFLRIKNLTKLEEELKEVQVEMPKL